MAEDDVLIEVDAVQAVYGDDCTILQAYPPHLHVHIKPRTADVSSQQFVEAVIGIRAGSQYPKEPPHICIAESKGLEEQRKNHLLTGIQDKACELSSCLMLVALCEEAVEILSSMNHPEGNCPLCLYPLVEEHAGRNTLPFMKLMSCFHCFHCDCIIRWCNWLQSQKEVDSANSLVASVWDSRNIFNQQGVHTAEESTGSCPVCRKFFHAKDIEHVLDLVGTHFQLSSNDAKFEDDAEYLTELDSEKFRRQKFEAILKLQQENNGLIEPPKNVVLLPGMFLPLPVPKPTAVSAKETTNPQNTDTVAAVANSSVSSNRPSTSAHRNSGARKHRGHNSRNQTRKWIKKESGNED